MHVSTISESGVTKSGFAISGLKNISGPKNLSKPTSISKGCLVIAFLPAYFLIHFDGFLSYFSNSFAMSGQI